MKQAYVTVTMKVTVAMDYVGDAPTSEMCVDNIMEYMEENDTTLDTMVEVTDIAVDEDSVVGDDE